jgi:adenylate cyclase class 2
VSSSSRGENGRPEEVEVKIPCEELDRLREALRAEGATLAAPLHEESNDLYDDADGRLSAAKRALRLRRTGTRTVLTFKGPPRFQDGVRRREEREVEVSDAAETHGILEGLGLQRRFRYEKRREEWQLEGCAVALDETPIGRFVEVEGAPPAIRRVFVRLGLDFAGTVPYSYPELYARRRKEDPGLPEDMVFEGRKA